MRLSVVSPCKNYFLVMRNHGVDSYIQILLPVPTLSCLTNSRVIATQKVKRF